MAQKKRNTNVKYPFHFDAVGTYYHKAAVSQVIRNRVFTSGQSYEIPCKLQSEPSNPHDKNAVKVMVADTEGRFHHVGYAPKRISLTVKKMIKSSDAMCRLSRKLEESDKYVFSLTLLEKQPSSNSEEASLKQPKSQQSVRQSEISKPKRNLLSSFFDHLIGLCSFLFMAASVLFAFGTPIYLLFLIVSSPQRTTPHSATQDTASKPTPTPTPTPKIYNERRYTAACYVRVNSNDSVGNDWLCSDLGLEINGVSINPTDVFVLTAGDRVNIFGTVEEYDEDVPDYSDFDISEPFTITKEHLQDSFELVVTDIYVYENDGRYVGHEAKVSATILFKARN